MSLEELEILWREIEKVLGSDRANLWRIRRRRGKRAFEGTLFQIPKPSPYRSYANKRIDVHVLLDGAVEFFYQNQKIARFDSKTTHAFGLYRTNGKREGFRYGPLSAL